MYQTARIQSLKSDFLPFGVGSPGITAKARRSMRRSSGIKYTARGYCNEANYIAMIYFHFGALKHEPLAT